MPTSIATNVPEMMTYAHLVINHLSSKDQNKSNKLNVLDIGVGVGTWGINLRNYLDLPKYSLPSPYSKRQRRLHITGIESFKKYIGPYHRIFYDSILIGDAFKLIDTAKKQDLAILGDVIEHFELERGKDLMRKILKKCKFAIVSTPLVFLPQGEMFGNKAEEHLSLWTMDDFSEFNVLHYSITSKKTCLGHPVVPLLVVLLAQGKTKAKDIKGTRAQYQSLQFSG